MLLDKSEFWFTKKLENGFHTFVRELAALPSDAFDAYPVLEAYTGLWSIFPLIGTRPPDGYSVDLEANRALCPETFKLLNELPRIQLAAFSRLDPNTEIHAHKDLRVSRNIRCHLGLFTPQGAELLVGGTPHRWERGKLLLFDGQFEHGAKNFTNEARTVLMVDMELTPAECAVAGI